MVIFRIFNGITCSGTATASESIELGSYNCVSRYIISTTVVTGYSTFTVYSDSMCTSIVFVEQFKYNDCVYWSDGYYYINIATDAVFVYNTYSDSLCEKPISTLKSGVLTFDKCITTESGAKKETLSSTLEYTAVKPMVKTRCTSFKYELPCRVRIYM